MLKKLALDMAVKLRHGVPEDDRRRYEAELESSDLVTHLEEQTRYFRERYQGKVLERGRPVSLGASRKMGRAYYSLVRHLRPTTMIETGVCNGVSSAFILLALEHNGHGRLLSIDYPEYIDSDANPEIWSGKGGAAVPSDQEPGWMIPDHLRERWTLILGKSTDRLRPMLQELDAPIDCFLHDSEHSYECMIFEYSVAWQYLARGGVLASNDIKWNRAFLDFSMTHGRVPRFLTPNDAFIRK